MSIITVYDCATACRYVRSCCGGETSVIISIRTPHDEWTPRPQKAGVVQDILYLQFHDVEKTSQCMPGITDEDGARIASFVNQWWDKVDRIIVHCDAGQSRSAGVAAAILKVMTGNDEQIFSCPMYTPNMLCYRTVFNALSAKLEES